MPGSTRPLPCVTPLSRPRPPSNGLGQKLFGSDAPAMGLGMSRVPSLQFNLEIEEDAAPPPQPSETDIQRVSENQKLLRSLLRPRTPFEQQLKGAVRVARKAAADRGCQLDCNDLAATLQTLGFSVHIRSSLGGGPHADCMENLSHEFLIVDVPWNRSSSASSRVYVDVEFRSQFEVAQSTPAYLQTLEAVDAEFVGTEEALRAVVTLVCEEMTRAFEAHGTTPPPWRRSTSMLSKWCPKRSEDRSPEDRHTDFNDASLRAQLSEFLRTASSKQSPSSSDMQPIGPRFPGHSPWGSSAQVRTQQSEVLPWLQDGHLQNRMKPVA